jgi:uncharacterized membrane protein YphA (DoxX/SURF4 family)
MKRIPPFFRKNNIIYFLARLILGGVFLLASVDKIFHTKKFVTIVIGYQILPPKIAIFFAFILPWLEFFLGLFLILNLFVRESTFVLSFLLLSFIAAIAFKALSGDIENCGCFSLNSSNSHNVFFLLIRDVLFLICGLTILFLHKKIAAKSA